MPAIQLERLQTQTTELAALAAEPEAFISGWHNLLEFYADRTRQPGQSGTPTPLLNAYNVPPPVLRQTLRALKPCLSGKPNLTLALADALWEEDNLECRLMAAQLLDLEAGMDPDEVIQRAAAWAQDEKEIEVHQALFNHGLARQCQDNPAKVLGLAARWLNTTMVTTQILGLRVINALLANPRYENLPPVFRLLGPLAQAAPRSLRPDLVNAIQTLARRTPPETAYFLRQSLVIAGENPGAAWLIRQVLPSFPDQYQTSLREALKQARGRSI